jgi:hypothetical protein
MAESAPKKAGPPALVPSASAALEAAVGGADTIELPPDLVGDDAATIRAKARQLENATRQVRGESAFFSSKWPCACEGADRGAPRRSKHRNACKEK